MKILHLKLISLGPSKWANQTTEWTLLANGRSILKYLNIVPCLPRCDTYGAVDLELLSAAATGYQRVLISVQAQIAR